jgi:hypothetical protein
MKISQLKSLEKHLSDFVEQFAPIFGRLERRFWCKLYLTGLLLDGERKSIEPLAARVPGADEQSLQQFVNQSPWSQQQVQIQLIQLLIKRFGKSPGVLALDDTSLPKKANTRSAWLINIAALSAKSPIANPSLPGISPMQMLYIFPYWLNSICQKAGPLIPNVYNVLA